MTKVHYTPLPTSVPISDWSAHERPREKLVDGGPEQLSTAELLATILRSGSRREDAVSLARRMLLAASNQIDELARWSVLDFMRFDGVGQAKAVALVAALELGRRRESIPKDGPTIFRDSSSVYRYLRPHMGDLTHEVCQLLCLNQRCRLLSTQRLSSGGLTSVLVDARRLYKQALGTPGCTSVILAHNHPSDDPRPSQEDLRLTQKIARAGQVLDIRLHDHLIVARSGYYSFADEGALEL